MPTEGELMAAARKSDADRTDAERAALGGDNQLSQNVKNELHATSERVKVYGS